MILDLEEARYCAGYGDIVLWRWFPSVEIIHGDKKKRDMFERLGGTAHKPNSIIPDRTGKAVDRCYTTELLEGGINPRWRTWTGVIGLDEVPTRPELVEPTDKAKTWAKKLNKDVLIYPQCNFKARTWPAAYFIDLSWKLKKSGFKVAIMLQYRDNQFRNTPGRYWGYNWDHQAALIQRAKVVIGNDSSPAHFAGTLGCKTFAVMGPTQETVFSHCPDVECIATTPDKVPCVGCHFKRPDFRAACDQMCQALALVQPDQVYEKVINHIGGK